MESSNPPGRPREGLDRKKYKHLAFYYEQSLDEVIKEFKTLIKKEFSVSRALPHSCLSIALRRLILTYTNDTTLRQEIKDMIDEYIKKENAYHQKLINNYNNSSRGARIIMKRTEAIGEQDE